MNHSDFAKLTGRKLGAFKNAAARIGIDFETYKIKMSSGQKWCIGCKAWHNRSSFRSDASRFDGLTPFCRESKKTGNPPGWHGKPNVNPLTGKPGPAPKPPRAGDRKQARQRINVEVRTGHKPNPNSLPCTDCGHIGADKRHEYDHYLGYSEDHHYDVQAVCTTCHAGREKKRRQCSNKQAGA